MALRQTGVQLVVKDFSDYIQKLDQIQQAEKKAFEGSPGGSSKRVQQADQEAKAKQRALAQELRAIQANERERVRIEEQATKAKQRELAQQLRALQQNEREKTRIVEQEERKREREEQQRQRGGVGGALNQIAAGFLTTQALGEAFDITRQAALFQAQSAGLENLARSYGTASGDIIQAMRRAANGVLSSSDIIQAANKALLLDVAQTPAEFEEITRTAITLGRAMGLTATDAIDQFTTALGRKSLLILDNFGISSKQVRAEMEKLAQVQFGKALGELEQMQRDALFTEAALKIANEAAANIGENAGKASEAFERLAANAENLRLAAGTAFGEIGTGLADTLSGAAETAGQLFAFVGAGITGIADVIQQLNENEARLRAGEIGLKEYLTFLPDLNRSADEATEKFKDVARTMGVTFPEDMDTATEAIEKDTVALEDNTKELEKQIKARQSLARQAEQIALNFSRGQEDAARKLGRQQEKLDRDQAKARDKLFQKQQKELDKLEADAAKERTKFTEDATKREAKVREQAAQKEKDDQQKLLKELRQAQERFNLDQLQSRRRFQLSDRRLRAEGDILGLQQLREDYDLQQQEEKENFALQQKQTKENAVDQTKEQARNLEEQVNEIRESLREQNDEFETSLAERRGELLASFDEEEVQLKESQQEQRDELTRSYQEQLEDLRLSRERQLEDLGRSFVEQEGITKEGAAAVANELEKAFGEEGVADTIMTGFNERTESNFQKLFENLGKELSGFGDKVDSTGEGATPSGSLSPSELAPSRKPRRFLAQHGADFVVPEGHPNDSFSMGLSSGEHVQVTPANQVRAMQTVRMLAPVTPTSTTNLNLRLAGGFGVSGSGTITDAQIEMISERVNRDVTENFDEAVRRLARTRN